MARPKGRTIVILSLVICVVTRLRLVNFDSRGSAMPAFALASNYQWTLFPATVKTEYGDLYAPLFTQFSRGQNYSTSMVSNKRVKSDLVIMGNKIRQDFSLIEWGGEFRINFAYELPQEFVYNGTTFLVSSFSEENLVKYFYLKGFDKVVLADETTIAKKEETAWMRIESDGSWVLSEWSGYFNVTSPLWEGVKKIKTISFDKNWEKILDYEEHVEEGSLWREWW